MPVLARLFANAFPSLYVMPLSLRSSATTLQRSAASHSCSSTSRTMSSMPRTTRAFSTRSHQPHLRPFITLVAGKIDYPRVHWEFYIILHGPRGLLDDCTAMMDDLHDGN